MGEVQGDYTRISQEHISAVLTGVTPQKKAKKKKKARRVLLHENTLNWISFFFLKNRKIFLFSLI